MRRLHAVSAAAYRLGNGGHDAHKTIGIIWMLLLAAGTLQTGESVPMWVVVPCYAAMGLGTVLGGWSIVKTMGQCADCRRRLVAWAVSVMRSDGTMACRGGSRRPHE